MAVGRGNGSREGIEEEDLGLHVDDHSLVGGVGVGSRRVDEGLGRAVDDHREENVQVRVPKKLAL